jgi:hypothetical protein
VLEHLQTTKPPQETGFSSVRWWQDDVDLRSFITDFDVIIRNEGEGKDFKFNPRAVRFIALVKEGIKKPDLNYLKLQQETYTTTTTSTSSTLRTELTQEDEQAIEGMFNSTIYKQAGPVEQQEQRKKLAESLGVTNRALLGHLKKIDQ